MPKTTELESDKPRRPAPYRYRPWGDRARVVMGSFLGASLARHLIQPHNTPKKVDIIIISFPQVRKLRLREVRWLAKFSELETDSQATDPSVYAPSHYAFPPVTDEEIIVGRSKWCCRKV